MSYLINQTVREVGRHGQLDQTRHTLSGQPAAKHASTQRQRGVAAVVCVSRRSINILAAAAAQISSCGRAVAAACSRWCTSVCNGSKCFEQTVVSTHYVYVND